MGRIVVGTSGWSYAHWKGPFYAPSLPSGAMLAAYARRFASVEVNGFFYGLPQRATVKLARDLLAIAPADAHVLDPFMGGGAVGVTCLETGRAYIGIELSPEYFAVSARRLAERAGVELPQEVAA